MGARRRLGSAKVASKGCVLLLLADVDGQLMPPVSLAGPRWRALAIWHHEKVDLL